MPRSEEMYLLRTPGGQMATVMARSHVGALKRYLVQHPRMQPGIVSVKRRNTDEEWVEYRVDR